MQALTDRIVFAKVNGWEDTLMASTWRVTGYPALILMTADGQEVDRLPGFMPPEEFVTTVTDFLAGRGTLEDLTSRFSQYPDSLALLLVIGGKFQNRGMEAQAESCYAELLARDPANAQGQAPEALHSLAVMAYSAGRDQYDTAIARFDVLIARFPGSEEAQDAETWVPYIQARQEKYDEALARFEKFKVDHPESSEIDWVNQQIEGILKKKGTAAGAL